MPEDKKEVEIINELVFKNLKEFRLKMELTQQQVADELNISRARYANFEKRTVPPIFILKKLSLMYRLPVDMFLRDNELENAGHSLSVAARDSGVYGESRFTALDNYEKSLVMKVRRLNEDDKKKLAKMIEDLVPKDEDE